MFKFIGMVFGVGIVLCTGIILFDTSLAEQPSLPAAPRQKQTEQANTTAQVVTLLAMTKATQEPLPEATPTTLDEIIVSPKTVRVEESTNTDGVQAMFANEEKDAVQEEPTKKHQLAEDFAEDMHANVAVLPVNQQWHVFWKPFSNETSAQGFAKRLTQQTGIEISVISDSHGKHMVSFAFDDETDKQHILNSIKTKTGLNLGETL